MKNLLLYTSDWCPFCQRVESFLNQHGISVAKRQIDDNGAREDLRSIGGKSQVPCLIIDGAPMYESGDIINWFQERI